MKKILMIDVKKCTGCRICELVCSLSHDGECNPLKSRIRVFKIEEEGIDMPCVCQNCETPLCRDVCPVGAIVRDLDTGSIVIKEDLCVGCRACTLVCPYGAITMDTSRGVMLMCDLCGGDPKCVKFCLPNALVYERSEVIDNLRQNSAMQNFVKPVLKSREIAYQERKEGTE